jgi:hypothetical protein
VQTRVENRVISQQANFQISFCEIQFLLKFLGIIQYQKNYLLILRGVAEMRIDKLNFIRLKILIMA